MSESTGSDSPQQRALAYVAARSHGGPLALGLPCALEWHPGFRLHVDEMARHPTFRGLEFVTLGTSLAVDGWLTPAILEATVRTARHHPQDVKKVWPYLARFGDLTLGRFGNRAYAYGMGATFPSKRA